MEQKQVKNWLKENWFKVGLLLLVIVFGIFYFYSDHSAKFNYLKEKCRVSGEKYDKEFMLQTFSEGENPVIAEYTYSTKLGTCVFSAGWFNANTGTYHFVRDLNTNRTLAEYRNSFSRGYIPSHEEVVQDLTNNIQYMKAKKEIFNHKLENEEQSLLDGLEKLE